MLQEVTPYILFYAGFAILGTFVLGFFGGWIANTVTSQFLNRPVPYTVHPEMFDENGNLVPDEILALRFENYNDTDDEEEDDDYLQKFDDELRTNFINKHHPEVSVHNYEEVKKLAVVVRDGNGTIIDQLHRTIPIMTKYESTRILGQRAKQIENGAQPLVSMSDNIIDSYIIAENELKEKKIPFIIRRPIPNGGSEYWYAYDLELLH